MNITETAVARWDVVCKSQTFKSLRVFCPTRIVKSDQLGPHLAGDDLPGKRQLNKLPGDLSGICVVLMGRRVKKCLQIDRSVCLFVSYQAVRLIESVKMLTICVPRWFIEDL